MTHSQSRYFLAEFFRVFMSLTLVELSKSVIRCLLAHSRYNPILSTHQHVIRLRHMTHIKQTLVNASDGSTHFRPEFIEGVQLQQFHCVSVEVARLLA